MAIQKYEERMTTARINFASSSTSKTITSFDKDEMEKLHRFLFSFSSHGYFMTDRVESWIRRAGEQCEAKGFKDVGKKLVQHAAQEAGHEQMMKDDAQFLEEKWQELGYGSSLERKDPPSSVGAYAKLHEDTIEQRPFAQIAIEYEIESLSLSIGPKMLKNWQSILPADFKTGMSFLIDHVELDEGHTKFNRKLLTNFLAEHPDCLDDLVETGQQALEIYGTFLSDCLSEAEVRN